MRKFLRVSVLLQLLLLPHFAVAQSATHTGNCPGVPGACGYTPDPSSARVSNPPSPLNGNGSLGVIYDFTACGLDFTTASQRLGKRFSPAGISQPAPFVISGVPPCAVITKAYLWAEGSGNGAAQTANINGPAGSFSFPMTIVGQGPDKCWGYSGSYTYRADVTTAINGNGTYNISGILTNPPTPGNDMDGATLMVIWSVPTATFQGRIIIADGAKVVNGGNAAMSLPISPAVCGPTQNAKAFCGIGDIQFNVSSMSLNSTPVTFTWNWWNYVQTNTTVANGQTTAPFNVSTAGDCYNLCVMGLYFQTTTCAVCPTNTLASTSTPATCSNCNGTASVTVSQPGTYTFTWSPAATNSTSGNTNTATGLCPGTYTVTATSGCTTTTTTVVVANAGGGLTPANVSAPVQCNGGCNGSSTITVSGGTAPFNFVWSPAATNSTSGNVNTGTSLCAGTYTVNISDVNGCTGTQTITITQPSALTSSLTSQTDNLCNGGNGGSLSVSASGGTPGPGYTYSWSPSGGSSATATGLSAQTYTCTITDANGCTSTVSATVTEPTALTVTPTQVDELCNGGNNGSATVSPSGGTPGYSYVWFPSGGSNPTASTLSAGNYSCTVSDANGCFLTQSFTITEPTQLIVSVTGQDAHCSQSDGSASASTSGGTGASTFAWQPSGSGPNLTNIPAGTYTVVATDANGCADSTTITINNLSGVVASLGPVTNVDCFGAATGAVSINASGGNPGYSYNWIPNVTSSSSATGIPAGSYQVTVVDANGCSSTVTVSVTQPPQLTITASATPGAVCNGASVQMNSTPAGGTPTLNVVWTPGNIAGNSATITPTTSGTYTATVTDANGCTTNATASVVVNPLPVAALSGDLLAGCSPVCVNFSDLTTVGAPSTVTTWSWDFGDGNVSTSQNPSHCFNTPGQYTVMLNVMTSDGCTGTISMPSYIDVFANPIAGFTATPQPASILSPTIVFQDTSMGADSWLWSFGDIANSSSTLQNPIFTYDDATCYQVVQIVSTVNGCMDSTSMQVCIEPDAAMYIPNAFTPNGDGINDYFMPVGMGLDPQKYEMWIFDRWGNMIFYTNDLSKGWDGHANGGADLCQIDTYVWKIKAYDINSKKYNLIGKVSLIR